MQGLAGRLRSASRSAACVASVIMMQIAAACSPDSPGAVSPVAVDPSFAILDLSGGPVLAEIKSVMASSMCVAVRNDAMKNGSLTELDSCSGATAQKFQFVSTGEIKIGSTYCLDAYGDRGRSGDAVVLWGCHGGGNQKWKLTDAGEIKGINGLCIAFKGHPTDGNPLFITTCRGDETKWTVASSSTTPTPGATVASVAVSLNTGSIAAGQTAQASAILKDANGNVLTGKTVSWTSSSSSIASVTAAGLITAVAAGTTNIVATVDGKSGSAAITVTGTGSTTPPPTTPPPSGARAVVPGLVGFGTTTPAGRGGTVLRVTNLNDGGAGSLRAALTASGPRVVIFDVSGTITLGSKISVNSPNLTVAGQTAPAPGITLKGAGISIRTNDVLIQHLRFRTGVTGAGNNDGIEILGPGGHDIVIDHISASWSGDENGSTWYGGASNITFSNAIFSENLGSGAVLIGDGTKNFLVVNTLFANNQDRNPYFKGGTAGVMANSVVYNWGGNQAAYTADPEGSGSSQVAVVGNVFIRGPSTQSGRPIQLYSSSKAGTKLYVAGNSEGRAMTPPSDPWSLVKNDFGSSGVASSPTVWPAGLSAAPGSSVYSTVLSQAGAWPASRDDVDQRIINDVRNGTGRMPSGAGPWPSLPTNQRALTLPANPNGDDNGNGYTNLEDWLQGLARAAEGR